MESLVAGLHTFPTANGRRILLQIKTGPLGMLPFGFESVTFPSIQTVSCPLYLSLTSIVFPFIAVTTSPGLLALPDGIFSHSGTRAVTLIGTLSLAMASNATLTVAAPPMSPFICPIPAAGLILIPPLQRQASNEHNVKGSK